MPTCTYLQELQKTTDSITRDLRRAVSPVFYSTDASGRVQRGLGAVPDQRPLLFVGNHSLLAPDMPIMVEQFLREKDMLLRGLAHPAVLQVRCQQMNHCMYTLHETWWSI